MAGSAIANPAVWGLRNTDTQFIDIKGISYFSPPLPKCQPARGSSSTWFHQQQWRLSRQIFCQCSLSFIELVVMRFLDSVTTVDSVKRYVIGLVVMRHSDYRRFSETASLPLTFLHQLFNSQPFSLPQTKRLVNIQWRFAEQDLSRHCCHHLWARKWVDGWKKGRFHHCHLFHWHPRLQTSKVYQNVAHVVGDRLIKASVLLWLQAGSHTHTHTKESMQSISQ